MITDSSECSEHIERVSEIVDTSAYVSTRCVLKSLRDHARSLPDCVALTFGKQTLTFAELDEWSARISSALQRRNAQGVVGVCMSRSHLSVVALMGIWRAGLTYLPLPPDFPREHLEHMCVETGVGTVLTAESGAEFDVDSELDIIAIEHLSDDVLASDRFIELDSIAAIFYTSGTTGLPKGVCHSMRSLLNRFGWWLERYPAADDEIFCLRTALSFIPSIWEMVSGILTGRPLVVVSDTAAADHIQLGNIVASQKITRLSMLPSFVAQIISADGSFVSQLKSLRLLVLAGEPASASLVKELSHYLPNMLIVNDYGCTELNGVISCDSSTRSEMDGLPTGFPITNCGAHIMDSEMRPVSLGQKGELCISGLAASSHYVNRPELQREKYVERRCLDGGMQTLFRTGDVAIMHFDGSIQVTGRMDNLVKVRGIRVELEAVENAMRKLDAVEEVAATTEKTTDGITRLVALVVPQAGCNKTALDYIEALKPQVPKQMLPSRIELVEALPKTANGKINRKALIDMLSHQAPLVGDARCGETPKGVPKTGGRRTKITEANILECLAAVSGIEYGRLSLDHEFSSQGIDSAASLQLMDRLTPLVGEKLSVTLLYEHSTPGQLLKYLTGDDSTQSSQDDSTKQAMSSTKIAIVGLDCRMPGAESPAIFWQNLCEGKDSVVEIPAERWNWREYYDADPSVAGKTSSRWGGFIADVDKFDASFFNISGAEAKYMSPEQRLLLQTCWRAIEDAGYRERDLDNEPVGIFMGARPSDYGEITSRAGTESNAAMLLGNDNAILSARIAYYMNMRGPAITVDTACSSSAVAIHMACESIRRGECHTALAGGVSLALTPAQYIVNTKAGMLSPNGRCATFDQSANGFVQGEGCGVVVLKSLSQAQADGDRIYAVIESSGVNQDGRTNGITAPNGDAQKRLLTQLYNGTQFSAADLDYIEAHGTGTKLGDPIEFSALSAVLDTQENNPAKCAIGSVKTNIGHLIAAAGVGGLIKVALSLYYRKVPPSLHYSETNEHIPLNSSRFYVNTKLIDWPINGEKRLAGLSSFGFSGTNCHIVLSGWEESRTEIKAEPENESPVLIILTAKDAQALRRNVISLRDWLAHNPDINLADVAYTLARRANQFPYRFACTAQSVAEAMECINGFLVGDPNDKVFVSESGPSSALEGQEHEELRDGSLLEHQFPVSQQVLHRLARASVNLPDFDLKALYPQKMCELVSLPSYAFEKKRYWIFSSQSDSKEQAAIASDEVSKKNFVSVTSKEHKLGLSYLFSIRVSRQSYVDHKISGQILWPGSAHAVYIQHALSHIGLRGPMQIEDWRLFASCELSDDDHNIGLTLTPCGQYRWRFEFSKGADPFSQGYVRDGRACRVNETVLDLTELAGSCPRKVSVAGFYERMAGLDIRYGSDFCGIKKIRVGSHLSVTKVARLNGAGILGQVQSLDSALHGAVSCLPEMTRQIPTSIDEFTVFSEMPNEFGVFAQVEDSTRESTQINLWLFHPTGRVFASVKRLQLKRVAGASIQGETRRQDKRREAQLLAFRKIDVPAQVESISRNVEAIAWVGKVDSLLGVRGNSDSYHQSLLDAYRTISKDEKGHRQIVWVFDQLDGFGLEYQCFALIKGITRLAREKRAETVDLMIACQHGSRWSPALLALGGAIKSLTLEHPDISLRIIHGMDLDTSQITRELSLRSNSREVHIRNAVRFVPGWAYVEEPLVNRVDAQSRVSLVTGGMGGIGRALVRHLSSVPGSGIVIAGRRTLSTVDEAWINDLRTRGAEVVYLRSDVSCEKSCKALLRKIKNRFGGLDRIYHCAGVTCDSLAINKTEEEVRSVFAAKVEGCKNLSEAAREFRLEYFVTFSSISAVFGTPGQVDYAAANAYLDAFVEYFNQDSELSGRAVSINWPLWNVEGMRPDEVNERRLAQTMGMYAMPAEIGALCLDSILEQGWESTLVLYGNKNKLNQFVAQTLPGVSKLNLASA